MDMSSPFALGRDSGTPPLPAAAIGHQDLFDDLEVALPREWTGGLPANREEMLACITRLCREDPGTLPHGLSGLARALGGPAMPLQRLHDLVQALKACGTGDGILQARWPEVTQSLAGALGGVALCEDHRDCLVSLAALPTCLRARPAWPVFEALARSLGGPHMAPRHCIGLAQALRREEHLAQPENLAALLDVLGPAPASPCEAARQRENLQALVAALTPCDDCDPDGPILLAGAMNFMHRCTPGASSIFHMSAPAIDALAQALTERLACEPRIGIEEANLHWLAVSLGRLAQGAANGAALLARAYSRLTESAHDIPAARMGMIVINLTEHACQPGASRGLDNPVVAEAVAQAMDPARIMPAAHRLAWLRSIAQLALPASGWADPVAQTDRLAPLAQAMFLRAGAPARAPVLALAAMALVCPWVPDEVVGGTDVQERPLLTCIALSAGVGLPALTAMALGAGRGLGLQDDPKALVRIRDAVDWLLDAGVPFGVAQAIGRGLRLAIEPGHLLDEEHSELALDDDDRLDWLEAACLLPRHAVASRPDALLEAIESLAIPQAREFLRHALVERVLAGRQPPAGKMSELLGPIDDALRTIDRLLTPSRDGTGAMTH